VIGKGAEHQRRGRLVDGSRALLRADEDVDGHQVEAGHAVLVGVLQLAEGVQAECGVVALLAERVLGTEAGPLVGSLLCRDSDSERAAAHPAAHH
jgi:hypothetical protein